MVIGVPREIKVQEHRVGLTPAGVRSLVEDGHRVLVETGAGLDSGLGDDRYRQAGAGLVDTPAALFAAADLVVKVKEPLPAEYPLLRPGQLLFTYLHLAPDPAQAAALLASGCTAIAYETVSRADGSLPLLQPMSEIAGRLAPQVGAHWLQKEQGGKGVLLGGAPGVSPARVVILGGGTVGRNAARIAVGMGAAVTVLDVEARRLAALDDRYGNRLRALMASSQAIEEEVAGADLLIGAVLVAGDRAPRLVPRQLVAAMEEGSVIVDVAIDQGGCVETMRATTHDRPVYRECGVIHYGVANMPGAVCRTSTFALTNATLPYVRRLAGGGLAAALDCPELRGGINVHAGAIVHPAVATALQLPLGKLT